MNHRSLAAFLLFCFALSLPGCSMYPSKKGVQPNQAKAAQPKTAPPGNTVEWKNRTWANYFEDKGVIYYLEKESISNPKPNIIQMWRKRTFPNRQISSHKDVVTFDEIDCRSERFRSLQLQALGWDDIPTPVYQRPSPWSVIYDGTAEDVLVLEYCTKDGTAAKPK